MKTIALIVIALAVAFGLFKGGAYFELRHRKAVLEACIKEADRQYVGRDTPAESARKYRENYGPIGGAWMQGWMKGEELKAKMQCEKDYAEGGFFSLR